MNLYSFDKGKMSAQKILSSTAAQKVWDFFCQNSFESFFSAQVAEKNFLSKGGTNQILRDMARRGLLLSEKKGRMIFYRVDSASPLARQFKVLRNVAAADEIIKKAKTWSERIILFGSCARGEDTTESDIDILIVTRDKDAPAKLVPSAKSGRRIQLVVKSPQEYVALEAKEPIFFQEVQRGIVLWEKK